MAGNEKLIRHLAAAAAAMVLCGVTGWPTLAAGRDQAGEDGVHASPALSTTPVVLAGTTVVSGSIPVEVPVTLPRPATVSVDEAIVQGSGRYVGFLLHQDGGWFTDMFYEVKHSYCTTPGCTGEAPATSVGEIIKPGSGGGGVLRPGNPGTASLTGSLPAGNYHLYLIADGSPAQVTLVFHGLSGQLALSPTQPATTVTAAPNPDLAVPSRSANAYAAGMTRQVTGGVGSLTFITIWVFQKFPDEPTDIGECSYIGNPPSRFPAYQDPCPGTSDGEANIAGNEPIGSTHGPLRLADRYASTFSGGFIEAPLDWSMGGFVDTVGPVIEAPHVQELWLDL